MKKKNTEELIKIIRENPELEIIPVTYWEVVCEDWGYWCGSINDVRVDYFYQDEERWYADKDDIMGRLYDKYEDDELCEDLDKYDFNKFIDNMFNSMVEAGKIKRAIIVFIGLP